MFERFTRTAMVAIAGISLASCGSDEDSQIIQKFIYDVSDNVAEVGVEFRQDVELNSELVVPIKDYGSLSILPGNSTGGLQVLIGLNLEALGDQDFLQAERTRLLPNGQSMSRYVETDVVRLRFQPHEKVGASLYAGLEENQNYLGAGIELSFLGKDFPDGLVISQRVRDSQNRQLGVVTIYGPKIVDEEVVSPGGLFFMTNISDLINYGRDDGSTADQLSIKNPNIDHLLIPDEETYIIDSYRDIYSKPKNVLKLLQEYRRQGRQAGLID